MRYQNSSHLAYQFKAHPTLPFEQRYIRIANCTFFSFGMPLAAYFPDKRFFVVLAEAPTAREHPKATYIAHHLRDLHSAFPYALRVPQLIPLLSTPEQIYQYHTDKLMLAQQLNSMPMTELHSAQLRILNEYFPPGTWFAEARVPQTLPTDDELSAAELAGFVSLPPQKPPLKNYKAIQTHDTYTALIYAYFDEPLANLLRCNKLHKAPHKTALFYGKQQIAYYSEQSKRFYILVDHHDPKILAVLRELHSVSRTRAIRRTVLIPTFDSTDPETTRRIFNRHLIGIARFITGYVRDCQGARDTAQRFKDIRAAAVKYFRMTEANEEPYMPTDQDELAALRRFGAFRTMPGKSGSNEST